jgi:putative ABC transport system ATP-binding protein
MLELQNLIKTFNPGTPNEVRALRGVTLTLERGSFLIIIGTNGSGKSTLLNAVAGTFLVDSGRITLANQNITRLPEHRRAPARRTRPAAIDLHRPLPRRRLSLPLCPLLRP